MLPLWLLAIENLFYLLSNVWMNVLLNTPRVQYPPTVNVSSPVARMKQQFDNVGWQLNRLATRVANSRASRSTVFGQLVWMVKFLTGKRSTGHTDQPLIWTPSFCGCLGRNSSLLWCKHWRISTRRCSKTDRILQRQLWYRGERNHLRHVLNSRRVNI